MKKIVSVCLLLAILMSFVICAQAAGSKVVFTSGSKFEVGGTAKVDILKTSQKVMDDPNVMADMYNAALEQDMEVTWICSNGSDKKGKSVTWTAEDEGKEYVCRVGFYANDELTEFIDYIDSDPFVIAGKASSEPVVITPEGPFYLTVGQPFKQQLSCNVKGVTFENFRTSFPNGIDISPSGLISGTPTKEGSWYVTIVAYKDGEQIGDLGAEFHVAAAPANEPPQITTKSLPEATVGKDYYIKLKCTDPDASFGEWYSPGKANDLSKTGLVLTQHGELEGKPTKAGTYTFTICAVGEAGEGYMTYTLVVKDAEVIETTVATTEAIEETQEATEVVAEPVEGTEASEPAETSGQVDLQEKDKDKDGGYIWILVGAGLGLLILCMVAVIAVVIVLLLKKKKA